MLELSDEKFQELIDEALTELPKRFTENLKNVAILYEDDPTPGQRGRLKLCRDQTLLGLYEGVPLAERQGLPRILPDKITLFKNPMLINASNVKALKKVIKHTLWHEIAHYHGLNHARIHELERGF
jgi:predicted Zn-dependent protease with MMP-like domain